ncbi:MAG: rhomboid family intramembrane serine protease [Aquisalimonadaceae bacterium]
MREQPTFDRDPLWQEPRRPSMLPPVVLALLIVNGVVFLLQGMFETALLTHLALWPLGGGGLMPTAEGLFFVPAFQPWQLGTYGFLHGNLLHLFVNMFALWMFGVPLEHTWGSRRFAFYFMFCVVGAGVIQLVVASQASMPYPTVGASGGVFGILLGFGMLFPNQRVMLLFPPIPMKAKYFVIAYGAFELYAGFTGSLAGIAHFAHLGGMLFGFLLIQYWRRRFPFAR